MGTFKVMSRVWNISNASSVKDLELIVDTGATYTTLPRSLLKALGVRPVRKTRLRMANGRLVERSVGELGIEVEGKRQSSTPVVFGDEHAQLLGAVTLEELSLAADPVRKRLIEAEAYLLLASR